MLHRHLTASLCLVALLAAAAFAEDKAVFTDDFAGYANNVAAQAVWQRADETSPNAANLEVTSTFEPAKPEYGPAVSPEHAPFAKLNNGVVFAALDQPLDAGFTLTCKVLLSQYSRSAIVALLDADGKQGYGVRWNGTQPNQYGGNGAASIQRFSLETSWDNWDVTGDAASEGTNSSHPVTGYAVDRADTTKFDSEWKGFAQVTLSYDKSTNLLQLTVDDTLLATVRADADLVKPARIYLRGNTTACFDDITLTTAE